MDRRILVLAGLGLSTALCATYPFIHSVPLLVLLGASEALGYAAAMPALQSLLTQGAASDQVGRIQGVFGTSQTACTAIAAAGAGAAFGLASWLPFVSVAGIVTIGLVVAAVVWRPVAGRVQRAPADLAGAQAPLSQAPGAQAPLAQAPGVQAPLVDPVGVSADVQ
jgi:DHA1 family multidrug resistance protein-like MFS transporter